MKPFLFILLVLVACTPRTTETDTATDSLAVATDTLAVSEIVLSEPSTKSNTASVIDASVPDSLKSDPLAVYHGHYRLVSSSSAEQARMTITFEGNRTFSYSIDYGVADFCSDIASGRFTVDGTNTGNDPVEPEPDENRQSYMTGQLRFTLGEGRIEVSDGIHEFGVGVCNFSGEFLRCDGECPEIKGEDYGAEETEGDSVR